MRCFILFLGLFLIAATAGLFPFYRSYTRASKPLCILIVIIFIFSFMVLHHAFLERPDKKGYFAIGGTRGRFWT